MLGRRFTRSLENIMRHMFLALLLVIGCGGEKVQTVEQNEVSNADASAISVPESVPENEAPYCPGPRITNKFLQSVSLALLDSTYKDKFDEWQLDDDGEGKIVHATFHRDGVYYKVYLSLGQRYETRVLSFSTRTDRPFSLDSLTDHVGHTSFYDQGVEGCVNYGESPAGTHGTLEWLRTAPVKGLEHHAYWQASYKDALLALANTLWGRQ